MATLDDKLLGEKLQNYCSSSESDDEKGEETMDERKSSKKKSLKFIPESEIKEEESWKGIATNTGPKGVIKDWQRFKQLEQQKNQESEAEKRKLVKKLALTCKSADLDSHLEEENLTNQVSVEDLEKDIMEDAFFQEYVRKKFIEMNRRLVNLPKFGNVIELNSEMFLSEIDNENKLVKIIIHIYDQKMSECRLMNECLNQIAKDYLVVKFCKVKSSEINLSDKFKKSGCPALLIYQGGELIGNFVKMNDEFGDEFCASDVENFLLEQGYLPSQEISSIRDGVSNKNELSDDE